MNIYIYNIKIISYHLLTENDLKCMLLLFWRITLTSYRNLDEVFTYNHKASMSRSFMYTQLYKISSKYYLKPILIVQTGIEHVSYCLFILCLSNIYTYIYII